MDVRDLLRLASPPSGRRRFGAWQIEITTRCPLACRMCARRAPDPWCSADMPLADFEALALQLSDVETVVLQGWGEPLLHPALVEIVRLAKRPGAPGGPPAVGFVTSGKGLDRGYAAALVQAGLDFVGFSLAGVSPATHAAIRVHSTLEEVVSAAEHVAAVRGPDGRRPRIHVAYLMLKDNVAELPGLPALARRMGADEIVLTNLVHVADVWQERQQVFGGEHAAHEALLAETAGRARALGLAFRRPSLAPAPPPVCEEDPLRNLYVGVAGDVSPCVYLGPPFLREFTRRFGGREHRLGGLRLGNAFREPIRAIRDAPEYGAFCAPFVRRARRHLLRSLLPASWRDGPGAPPLPEGPEPCRTCHKLLGA
jgi:MoaA/NifB/PqqE/SkfB family radical SAM enzyme